jgi:hypothetical protein
MLDHMEAGYLAATGSLAISMEFYYDSCSAPDKHNDAHFVRQDYRSIRKRDEHYAWIGRF